MVDKRASLRVTLDETRKVTRKVNLQSRQRGRIRIDDEDEQAWTYKRRRLAAKSSGESTIDDQRIESDDEGRE